MTEYDTNIIKPVDGLQNITGLNPARRHEERKRGQQRYEQNREESESTEDKSNNMFDESTDKEGVLKKGSKKHDKIRDSDVSGIDFCA